MVLREGAELALILRAVELSSEGLQTWIGTIIGISGAVAVGLFFFKGTLRIPLHRFFCVDERHSNARGVSTGAYRAARAQRSALAAFEQSGDGDSGTNCPERAVLFRVHLRSR